MYLVSYPEFLEFLKTESIEFEKTPITDVPCIVEFRRGEVLKAKIELVSLSAFEWNRIYGLKSFKKSENKYWIRGKEWDNHAYIGVL